MPVAHFIFIRISERESGQCEPLFHRGHRFGGNLFLTCLKYGRVRFREEGAVGFLGLNCLLGIVVQLRNYFGYVGAAQALKGSNGGVICALVSRTLLVGIDAFNLYLVVVKACNAA